MSNLRQTKTESQDAFQPYEQMSQDILENLPVSVIVLNPAGVVLTANQAPLEIAHLQRADVLGKLFIETPWWSDLPVSQQRLSAALEEARKGKIVHFEARIRADAGKYLERAATITPHLDAAGCVEYLIYSSSDITVRKHAEDELRALVDAMPQLVWIGRPDGFVEYHNQRWRDYTNLPLEQTYGYAWCQSLHPADLQKTLIAWSNAIQGGNPYEVEERLLNGNTGDYQWFLARGAPYRDVQGTIVKWIGTLTDIDGQKRVEQTLKESREQLRALAETLPQLVWTTRPDAYLEDWNQQYIDYFQVSPQVLRGYGWRQFLHPEDYEAMVAIRSRSLETGEPYEMEYRLRDGRTGKYRWFLARGEPVRDDKGQILRWVGTCTDIEDQKRIEENLRQSQERAQALMESSIIGIVVTDNEKVVEANDAFLQMTGYTQEEVQSGTLCVSTFIHPEDRPRDQQAVAELAVFQQVKPYETTTVCKDGSRQPVLIGIVALPHHPSQSIAFVLDNSARKELEQRKDDFISMAGHELKTPITSLKLQTQLLEKKLARQTDSSLVPALSRMEKQVKNVERLVGELLDVSKIQAGRLEYLQEKVDMEDLLREVVESMQQLNMTHTITMCSNAPHPLMIGDRGRLGQVFINLISNAIKYSPDANTIEIEMGTRAGTVTISVRDHGIGIPKAQCEKIFERFYRAVTPSQQALPGLGMGLYIVAEIVKQHGGTITVDSEVGKGSVFSITFPLERNVTE